MPLTYKFNIMLQELSTKNFRLKKRLRLTCSLLVLFLFPLAIKAQWLYVATNGQIAKVNIATCQSTVIVPTTGVLYDIAMCPGDSNTIYGISAPYYVNGVAITEVYSIDVKTGVITTISNSWPSSMTSTPNCLNSLVCDGNGNLYAADALGSGLYKFDLATKIWSQVGGLGGYSSSGDLTYYKGKLYLSTTTDDLITISLSPFSYKYESHMNITGVYGVNTVSFAGCNNNVKMVACSGSGDIYYVDPVTGKCTSACAGLFPGGIFGATSALESDTVKIAASAIQPAPVCAGESVTLFTHSNQSNVTWTWTPGTSADSTFATTAPASNTTYTITVTNSKGCTATTSINLVVNPKPSANPTSTPETCGGLNGTANANASGGTAPYNYTWSMGSNSNSISGLSAGNYAVSIQDNNGCTNTASVFVNTAGGFTVTQSGVDLKCAGATNGVAQININSGTGPFSYSWDDGQTTPAAVNLKAGTYTCVVTDNSAGCSSSFIITLTEPPSLQVKASGLAITCNGACNGQATIISMGGTAPHMFGWSNGVSNSTLTNLCAGNYAVTVTDGNGCTHDTSIVVADYPALLTSKDSIAATCGKPNGSASVILSGGIAPYSYTWNNGSQTAAISGLLSGTYVVTIQDVNGCSDIAHMLVGDIYPGTLAIPPHPNLACFGDKNGALSVTVSAGGAPYTYSWSNGALATASINNLGAGIYSVTVTDKNGCVGIAKDSLLQPTKMFSQPSTKTICAGQPVTLTANVGGGTQPYSYVWNNTQSGISYSDSPVTTTTYTLQSTDANGCTVTQTHHVQVDPIPVVAFTAPDVCLNSPTIFKDGSLISSGTITSWNWDFGDGSNSQIQKPTHTYAATGTYTVNLIASSGSCQSGVTQVVNVYPSPKADFSVDPQPASVFDSQISFTDLSKNGVSGRWFFGDNTNEKYNPGTNPIHTYPNENKPDGETYLASLSIVNMYGCRDSAYKTIHINPEWTFYIPNAFSPNEDHKNDLFYGTGFGIVEKEMWIYDRWGLQLFHTADLNGGWNGKYLHGGGNELVPQDVYVWVIQIKEVLGKSHEFRGHVTVIR